ncbi:hypothetical protein M9Y10_005641, partial [Tritrichomonas musculus]
MSSAAQVSHTKGNKKAKVSKKTAAQTVPNFNINQDLVNYFQRQNTENQNVTENQNPLTVESALERIKSYSQKPSQKAPKIENTVIYDSGNGSQSPKKHDSSPGDALLKQLKGPKKWNHQNPPYSQKVPPKDTIDHDTMEECLSQNFQPLTIDDEVLSKFDEQHLKNFFFTTKYQPNISEPEVD